MFVVEMFMLGNVRSKRLLIAHELCLQVRPYKLAVRQMVTGYWT